MKIFIYTLIALLFLFNYSCTTIDDATVIKKYKTIKKDLLVNTVNFLCEENIVDTMNLIISKKPFFEDIEVDNLRFINHPNFANLYPTELGVPYIHNFLLFSKIATTINQGKVYFDLVISYKYEKKLYLIRISVIFFENHFEIYDYSIAETENDFFFK